MRILNSIKAKFTLSILIVSLFPFFIFLILSLKEGKGKLLENVYSNLTNQISILVNLINIELEYVDKHVHLWSKLQVLDDILVDDIDKRIQNFIDNIHKNLGLEGIIICANKNGKVIASTRKNLINKTFSLKYLKNSFTDLHKPNYLDKHYLKFSYPIYASFDKNKLIGYLVFLYDTQNLFKYISNTDEGFTIIFNKDKTYFIGQSIDIFDKLSSNEGFTDIYGYIVVYKKIKNNILKDNWYILFAIDENFLFEPIYELNKIFLLFGSLGILLIIVTSFYLSTKITKPIEELTDFVKSISKKKKYTQKISIDSGDEIKLLADAFNQMINEINNAFKQLEKESLERLKLFLKLTETFNKVMQSENVEEVFEIINNQLKDFENIKEVGFSISKVENAINAKIKQGDVDGYLYFKIDGYVSDIEEKFLMSIATFVNLWLERKELLRKSEASSRAKSAFIANMSHELRTPLNSIIGFAQFFQMDETLPEEYRELAKNIETSGRHLLDLINDILDFSKAEAGKVDVNKINTNISSVISDTLNIVKAMADEKGIYLKAYVDNDLTFETDVKLLRQILLNLLSNAVKFTEKGGVTVKVKRLCDKLFISVRDTGIGIEKENLDKLFQDFTQLENPMQKKYKGTGLGLSITKKYVELLGGKIKVYSKGLGKGTSFTFYIE